MADPQTTKPTPIDPKGDGSFIGPDEFRHSQTTSLSGKQRRRLLEERRALESKSHLSDRDLAVIHAINHQLGVLR
jgi:hypothetical protein